RSAARPGRRRWPCAPSAARPGSRPRPGAARPRPRRRRRGSGAGRRGSGGRSASVLVLDAAQLGVRPGDLDDAQLVVDLGAAVVLDRGPVAEAPGVAELVAALAQDEREQLALRADDGRLVEDVVGLALVDLEDLVRLEAGEAGRLAAPGVAAGLVGIELPGHD